MKIFAIDPGNINSAYCVMTHDYELLDFAKVPNSECMSKMMDWLHSPKPVDRVIVERVAGMGMAVGSEVFETCEWVGRFSQQAERFAKVEYIYRRDEKLYICGEMRAKDANIRAALIERFAKFDKKNGKGTKKNPDVFYGVSADCWAAIAVAVTWLDMQKEKAIKEKMKC